MAERTAAEVLAEKLNQAFDEVTDGGWWDRCRSVAARLTQDPAITVRTNMVVERFIVEIHSVGYWAAAHRTPEQVHHCLTTGSSFGDHDDHRVIVRPLDADR